MGVVSWKNLTYQIPIPPKKTKGKQMSLPQKIRTIRGGLQRQTETYQARSRELTHVEIPERPPSISILDEENRHALINLVPFEFKEKIKRIPIEYFELSEKDLSKISKPDDTMNRLKLRFWDEWQIAILSGLETDISIQAVYYGVCTEEYFYRNVFDNLKGLAWVITPPADYVVTMRDVLKTGIERLKDIITLPLYEEKYVKEGREYLRDEDGNYLVERKINKGVITEIRQIVSMLSDRVHGAIVQRLDVNQKSMHMELSGETQRLLENPGDPSPTESSDELSSIDDQLKKITAVLDGTVAKNEEEVIDAEPDTDTKD